MRARILIPIVLVSWSCGSAEPRTDGPMFTDSAGIAIVLSDSAVVVNGPVAIVTPAPNLDPRGPESVLEFFQVEGLVALDTAFGVINRSTGTLRIFHNDGHFQQAIGAIGRGPGEFRHLWFAHRYRGDSIVMRDGRNRRLTVFDRMGRVGRTFLLSTYEYGRSPSLVTVLRSGQLLAYAPPHMAGLVEQGTIVDSSLFGVHEPDGEWLTTVGRWPTGARMRYWREGVNTVLQAPFAPTGAGTAWHDGFCLGFGATFEVRCHNEAGELRQIFRVTISGQPLTTALSDRYEQQQLSARPSAYQRGFRRILNDITYPTTLPVYDRIVATTGGEMWVEAYRPFGEGPSVWWRLDSMGRFGGTAEFPERFAAYIFEDGIVRGVWRDELDVEHVQTYRVEWPNGFE